MNCEGGATFKETVFNFRQIEQLHLVALGSVRSSLALYRKKPQWHPPVYVFVASVGAMVLGGGMKFTLAFSSHDFVDVGEGGISVLLHGLSVT